MSGSADSDTGTKFTVHYVGGHAERSPEPADAEKPEQGYVWIDLAGRDVADLSAIASRFHLHPLAIEDATGTGRLPKAEQIADEESFVIATRASRDHEIVAFRQIAIFIGSDHVISVASDEAVDHISLRRTLEQVPELMATGPGYVLHGILAAAADSFTMVVDEIDDEVTDLEATIPDAALDPAKIARLLALRRQVKATERMLKPMEETARKLADGKLPCIGSALTIYFRDTVDQIRRAQAVCESIRDGLASVFEYSALLEQQRTGAVTKQLAAWAAILAVPTAVAGIYGMNFRVMPELAWDYGYPAIVAAMLMVSLLLYWRFRRSGWL